MNQPLTKNIVFAYFSGCATPLQKKVIEEWLREEANREQFFQWLEEWETEHPQFIPDTERALQRYVSRMNDASAGSDTDKTPFPGIRRPASPPPPPKRSSFFRWWMVAAALLISLSVGWFSRDILLYQTYQTAYGEMQRVQLPDGSQVTINANSALRVPRFGFGQSTREVFLTGEAEFVVTHTPDKRRFLVHTPDQLTVEVLGTEFVVKSRAQGTKVVLSKGKVQLKAPRSGHTQALTMQPGDVVEVDPRGKINRQSSQEIQVHTAWKENRFIFDNTALAEVASQIHERFGVRISIADPDLAERRITGTYQAENADELLDVISELLDLRQSRQDGKVVLTQSRLRM
jgi:transmembrane sensor